MSTTTKVFLAVEHVIGAAAKLYGSLSAALATITTGAGANTPIEQTFDLAAAGTATLYDSSVAPLPDFKLMVITPSAACRIRVRGNTPTTADASPLNPTWNEIPVTAGVPIILGSLMNTDSVAADHVGSAFSSGTTVAGRVGQVQVKAGAAACTLTVWRFN